MKSFHERISQIYYTYGLFCASHPIATIIIVILSACITCYPLSNLPLPGNTPLHYRTPVDEIPISQKSTSSFGDTISEDVKKPRWYQGESIAYIQQIVVKATVSPWHPQEMVASDAFRAPLASVFSLLQEINNFKLSDNSSEQSLADLCYRVSEPVNAKHLQRILPDYSCLILSPGNFWGENSERFFKDVDFIKTVYKRYSQGVESPPTVKDLLFGIPWKFTGISRYYIRNRQRVISYAITIVLKKHDPNFMSTLKAKLESAYPDSASKLNTSKIEDLAHVYFKEDNYFVEYTPLLVIYLVLLLYLYFSVCKIDMVKSKIGLAISAVLTVIASLLMSVSICTLFGLTPTLNGGEIFPYLVVVIGVENVLVITRSVVSTPVHLDVKIRVAQGLSREGWSITKNLLSELLIMFVGFFTFNPAIQEFCAFGLVGVLSDFYLQIAFFAPVLSVDIRRMELSDLQRQSVQQAVMEEPTESFNIQPLFLCPFASSGPGFARSSSRLASKSSQTSLAEMDQQNYKMRNDNRGNRKASMPERPRYEMPRRVKFFYFVARFRIVQKFIMVCTVIWIGLIIHKVGLVEKLTGGNNLPSTSWANPRVFSDSIDQPRPEDEGVWPTAGILREDDSEFGPVEHTDLESWAKLSYKHWPTLFHYYNISLSGRHISILPTIHLSEIISPITAKSMRSPAESQNVHSLSKQSDSLLGESDSHDIGDSAIPHYQQLNNFYPKSQREFVITIFLCIFSVIVITYFMIVLYKCMCSRNYSRWRRSWTKFSRNRPRGYIKEIKESVPLILSGHTQSIECLKSDNGLIVTCCLGGHLKIWDCNTGDCINTITRKRKAYGGRNIDDNEGDLYTPCQEGRRSLSSSEESLMMSADGDGLRVRKSHLKTEEDLSDQTKQSSSWRDRRDLYSDFFPDLTMAINTEFSSVNLSGAQATSSDGYDFRSWVEGAYDGHKDTPVLAEFDSQNVHLSSSPINYMLSPLESRSRSMSQGELSVFGPAGDDDLSQEQPPAVWCLDSQHGLIFTGCGNGRVEVWDCESGELRFHYSMCEIGVTNLCVVANRIVAARLDGSLDFIEIESFHSPVKVPLSLSPQSLRQKSKASHSRSRSDGKAGDVKLWHEVIRCSGVTKCRAHRQPINHLQCESGRVITASQDHTLKVFRFDNCLCLYTLHGHEGSVTALRLDKVAPYAAVSGSADGTVRIWDLLTGSCVHKFLWHQATVVSVLSSPLYIVSLGLDERMCIWDRPKATLIHTIALEQVGVGSAALLSLNLMVTGGQGSISLWDIPRGSLLRKVVFTDSEHKAFINHVSSVGNCGVVCDHGVDLKVIYFPTILEKAE